MYRARRTLILKFENDALDDSMDLQKVKRSDYYAAIYLIIFYFLAHVSTHLLQVLKEANTIMRMKRPMVEMMVDFKELKGLSLRHTHAIICP